MKTLRIHITACLLLLISVAANAQYVGEIGLMGGVSYYNGDANSKAPFVENHPMGGAFLRLKMSTHWLAKIDVSHGTVSGDTDNFPENHFPFERVQFDRDYWNIGAQFELNFFKYGISRWDKETKRHTPYVTAGPALAVYQDWNGNKLAGNLAFGVGYKLKVTPRLNIGVEWSMHKLFRDDFDVADYGNDNLDDPFQMGHSNLKNNDWYSHAFLFVSLDIFKRRGVCRSYE